MSKVAIVAVICMASYSAIALAAESKGIHGTDDRVAIDSSEGSWSAIGQINIGGYRKVRECTGTRIAPGVVLTAAHCVMDWPAKKPFGNEDIHFVAGVDKGTAVGNSTARCVVLAPDFIKRDMALVVLKQDIQAAGLFALAGQTPGNDSPVILAAYHNDRRQKLMADKTCQIVAQRGDFIATTCDAVGGSSGSPVLVEDNGNLRVVGVTVGITEELTFAKMVSAWPGLMADAKCE
jgi:protease YdgD